MSQNPGVNRLRSTAYGGGYYLLLPFILGSVPVSQKAYHYLQGFAQDFHHPRQDIVANLAVFRNPLLVNVIVVEVVIVLKGTNCHRRVTYCHGAMTWVDACVGSSAVCIAYLDACIC